MRVALRSSAGVYYLHGDHLGSVSLTTTSSGAQQFTSRYTLFGSVRSSSGGAVSDYRFTAQRQESLGNNWVYDYNGRFYNALIGRFLSADTLVPGAGNPQALNRYSYVLNDPLKYTDPSGHDLILVSGMQTDDWCDSPVQWPESIKAYKGWINSDVLTVTVESHFAGEGTPESSVDQSADAIALSPGTYTDTVRVQAGPYA